MCKRGSQTSRADPAARADQASASPSATSEWRRSRENPPPWRRGEDEPVPPPPPPVPVKMRHSQRSERSPATKRHRGEFTGDGLPYSTSSSAAGASPHAHDSPAPIGAPRGSVTSTGRKWRLIRPTELQRMEQSDPRLTVHSDTGANWNPGPLDSTADEQPSDPRRRPEPKARGSVAAFESGQRSIQTFEDLCTVVAAELWPEEQGKVEPGERHSAAAFNSDTPSLPSFEDYSSGVGADSWPGVQLRPEQIERGMIVEFDGGRRGSIDNMFISLDEFWVRDEETGEIVFATSADGRSRDVRSFRAWELTFTGQRCSQVEHGGSTQDDHMDRQSTGQHGTSTQDDNMDRQSIGQQEEGALEAFYRDRPSATFPAVNEEGALEEFYRDMPSATIPAANEDMQELNTAQQTVMDWANNQSQFAHLPFLPSGWIRIISNSKGKIYYMNTVTGQTTFKEPKESSLPAGWVEMTSRSTGKKYYWNADLKKSQFTHPLDMESTGTCKKLLKMLRKKVLVPTLADKFPQGPIDHGAVRGAKKGGITEHISGPHLIPNVGREAMVPAEIVCRRKPQAKKKAPPEPKAVPKQDKKEKKRKDQPPPKEHRFKEKDAPRHREKEERRHYSDSSSSDERDRDRSREDHRVREEDQSQRKVEEPRLTDELERTKEGSDQRRRQEEEEKRFQEEQRKLKELEEVRKKKQEIDSARRQKLGGLFALTEEDMAEEDNADARKARVAQERARALERRAQERPAPEEVKPQAYASQSAVVASVPRAAAASSAGPIVDDGNITAVDLDGAQHDHKFAKVWKDWDASKKSDPGEVARQFMKIAAIKRRGYTGGPGGGEGSGSAGSGARAPPRPYASRSRSRGRRRR